MLGPDALLCSRLPTPRCVPSKRMLTCMTCPCSVSVVGVSLGVGLPLQTAPCVPASLLSLNRCCCFFHTESAGRWPSPVVQPDSGAGQGCVVPAGGSHSPHAATECVCPARMCTRREGALVHICFFGALDPCALAPPPPSTSLPLPPPSSQLTLGFWRPGRCCSWGKSAKHLRCPRR